ncbi:hypothetical protein [Aquimonas sp.]|jgi:hypothetical protein|uniref:hypothetical protein n=1 Tax=Aquimonas sp. TaxID=1872588 RepID=UPI0037BF28F5
MRSISLLLVALLAGVLLPSTARSHDTLPAHWCTGPDETPVIASTFSFAPTQLQSIADETAELLGSEGLIAEGLAPRLSDGRCGIVDRWNMATYIARTQCSALSGHPNAMIFITGPASYNDSAHHSLYDYSHGLEGACIVCAVPGSPLLEP